MVKQLVGRIFGICAYLLFLISFAAFTLFLLDLGPAGIDAARGYRAWGINTRLLFDVALVLLFGLHHSLAARDGFKALFARTLPAQFERPVYVLASSILLLGICFLWQPITHKVWHLTSPFLSAAVYLGFGSGFVIAIWATFLIDHAALTGLKQSGWFDKGDSQGSKFRKPGLYRIVRHPLQLGILIVLWMTPSMSVGHLVLATTMTVYIFIGLYFEERSLLSEFGAVYADYRRQVGKILPKL